MVNALKLPVGIENFEEIRKLGFYYVDKTMLIEQLLQRWGNEFLQFAVLTGCLRISKESIFTGLTALLFAGNVAW